MRRHFPNLAALLLCFASTLAVAAAPGKVNLQGVLRADDGTPRDGTFNFKVQIFPNGGSEAAILDETYDDVPVASGIFTLEVGSRTPTLAAALAAATEPQVQITVNGVALPRQPLSSVMYALHSKSAETAPFAGVTGFPAPCGGNTVLTGYENGAPVCTPENTVQRRTAASPLTCPAGQFLRAVAADGTPVCAGVRMSCRNAPSVAVSATVATSSCNADEILTGGGCFGGPVTGSNGFNNCGSRLCICGRFGTSCEFNAWRCSVSSGTPTAQAICCTVE